MSFLHYIAKWRSRRVPTAVSMVLPVALTLGLSSITTWLPRAANMADKQCVKAAIGVYRAPRRQRWSSLETTSAASAPLPASLAATMRSRTIESCFLQLSTALLSAKL